MDKILVTGAAGFIGFHLCELLIKENYVVIGIDNINDYYDQNLKKARIKILTHFSNFHFKQLDISDYGQMKNLFNDMRFDYVINLAAQAGVRYSIENPHAYFSSNLIGFGNILEACKTYNIKHLIYASSSSVYGANTSIPFSTKDIVDFPISLYAATKKSNELMAHCYSHLFNLPTTGLRFFTVYGPWGRPDMAYFLFTKAIYQQEPIKVFNYGAMERDYTYITDIIDSILLLINRIPVRRSTINKGSLEQSSSPPYKIFNIGSKNPIKLLDFISILEKTIGIKAIKKFEPLQPGDVLRTYADVSDLETEIGYEPKVNIEEGIRNFVSWYSSYYKVTNV